MLQRFYKANRDLLNKIIFMTVFFLVVYLFFNYIFYYITPFVFGYIFSLILFPLVNLLNKKLKVHRGISSAFLIVIILFLLVILGVAIVTAIIDEAKIFSDNIPGYMREATVIGNDLKRNYDDLIDFIPDGLSTVLETSLSSFVVGLTASISNMVKQVSFDFVGGIPNFLLSFLLCIISTFFFTKDRDLIRKAIREASPMWLSDGYVVVRDALIGAIWGYVKAQLILMSFTAAICVIGLSIIGFPYSFLVGIAASLIDALPVFGVGFILWPAAFMAFVSGQYATAIGIMIIDVLVILTRQFLEPKILGSQIGLHPLLTLMSLYVGLRVFGILGFLIGPMILVVIKVILETDTSRPKPADNDKNKPIEPVAPVTAD